MQLCFINTLQVLHAKCVWRYFPAYGACDMTHHVGREGQDVLHNFEAAGRYNRSDNVGISRRFVPSLNCGSHQTCVSVRLLTSFPPTSPKTTDIHFLSAITHTQVVIHELAGEEKEMLLVKLKKAILIRGAAGERLVITHRLFH